jgi:hypothetical protein
LAVILPVKMENPIKIKTLDNDINECSIHLEYLKKTSVLGKELNEFITDYSFDSNALLDLNISNAHCVTTISQLEISLTLKSLYYSKKEIEKKEIEKKQILKNGILVIYESIKTLEQFNKLFKEYSELNESLNDEFKKHKLLMKGFKKSIGYDSSIKNIRNNISGHINSDYIEYSKHIDSIDIEKTTHFIVVYRLIINELNNYLYNCMILTKNN